MCWSEDYIWPSECKRGQDGFEEIEFRFLHEGLFYPAVLYSIWQIGYLCITEGFLGKYIYDDPDMQTSLRWLTTDRRAGIYKIATGACKALGVMQKQEELDPYAWKTKIIFVVSQLVYTLLVLLPVKLFHASYIAHSLWLTYLFSLTVWNGGSYYIEVFSRRYQKAAFPEPGPVANDAKETSLPSDAGSAAEGKGGKAA